MARATIRTLKLNRYISVTSDPIWVIQEPFESPRCAILLHKWICDLVRWMSCCIHLGTYIDQSSGWARVLFPKVLASFSATSKVIELKFTGIWPYMLLSYAPKFGWFCLTDCRVRGIFTFCSFTWCQNGEKLKLAKNWWKRPFGSTFLRWIQKSTYFLRKLNFLPRFGPYKYLIV